MKRILMIMMMAAAVIASGACSGDAFGQDSNGSSQNGTASGEEGDGGQDNQGDGTGDNGNQTGDPDYEMPDGESTILVAYFSATGNTRTVARHIATLTGADLYRIRPAEPYAENPYDDSDKIQDEAYNDLRPEAGNLPDESLMAQYETIFVGSPIWWHQPAMVVCTFLEKYDLSGKTVIPFFTYGATSYLNESMHKIYEVTPDSAHIPGTLPEDLDPDNIQEPQSDDSGIAMPGRSENSVRSWLQGIGMTD